MSLIGQHIMSLSRGEITPLMHARIDIEDYRLGAHTVENFKVLKYGGLTRIPGTLDLAGCISNADPSRIIPFVFSKSQAYALEFGDQILRFWTTDGIITSGGSPYEIATPYAQADLWSIQIETIGDVIYIACEGYQQKTLTRYSDTSWVIADFVGINGPWLGTPDPGSASLSFAGKGHATPDMTSNTAPSGTVTENSSSTVAWKLFNRNHADQFSKADNSGGWITYDFGSGNSKTVIAYYIMGTEKGDEARAVPINWSLMGSNDGSNYDVLDSQTNTSDWLAGETRCFELSNYSAYRYYRIRWKTGGDDATELMVMAELALLEDPDDQTPFAVTASAIDGINDGAGFSANDVGRLIRAMCDDGFWRTLRIEAYVSTTVVNCVVMGPAPIDPATTSTRIWQLQAWGDEAGWPRSVFKHKGRLGWASHDNSPRTGWLSVSADFDNYGTQQPLVDDDAINFSLANGDIDQILWGASNNEDLLLGTVGGIRVIGQRDASLVLSPSNHEEIGSTVVRACDVRPVFSGLILIFPDNNRKRLYETAFNADDGGYVARELTMLAEHIFLDQIKELHFQQTPDPTIWAVLDTGQVAVCTYDRQQAVFGVSRLVVPGGDATVESMCVLPTETNDVPMLVVKRTAGTTTTIRVERMVDPYRAGGKSDFDIPIYLMAAGRYTGAATDTITGLDYLNGNDVCVYDAVNNADLGDAYVSSGQITVPGGYEVTDALVGLRYTSKVTTLPPPNLPEDGRYLAHELVPNRFWIDVYDTYGLEVGGSQHTELLTTESDFSLQPFSKTLHTGRLEAPIDEGWSDDPMITVSTDSPFPATIRAMMVQLDRGS